MDSDIKEMKKETAVKKITKKRNRKNKPFATMCAADCSIIAEGIWKYASGQKIRRLTLFDELGKSPDSGPSRTLITASSKYGFTTGGYQAEYIELSENGYIAFNPEEIESKKLQAKFDLIVKGNEYFLALYEKYKGNKLPIKNVMVDYLGEVGLDKDFQEEAVSLFIENLKYLGLVKVMSGAERIISIEQAVEETENTTSTGKIITSNTNKVNEHIIQASDNATITDLEKTCFFIAPIGGEDSVERQHSDLFLESLIVPAIEEFGFNVVRADNISTPGLITNQIIDYIMNSGLVVCDLSFHNPNVFYELSLRHTTKKPTIHIIRKCDSIPFDINDFRTIIIDDSSIYTLIPSLETYRSQISQQIRQMLEDKDSIDNPILSYLEKNGLSHL